MVSKLGYPPRLPNESAKAYLAFCRYCDLHTQSRTVLGAVKLMEKRGEYQRTGWALEKDQPPTNFKRWYRQHRWKERARGFDPKLQALLDSPEPPSWEKVREYLEPDCEPPRPGASQIFHQYFGNTGDLWLDVRIDTLRSIFGGKDKVPTWANLPSSQQPAYGVQRHILKQKSFASVPDPHQAMFALRWGHDGLRASGCTNACILVR